MKFNSQQMSKEQTKTSSQISEWNLTAVIFFLFLIINSFLYSSTKVQIKIGHSRDFDGSAHEMAHCACGVAPVNQKGRVCLCVCCVGAGGRVYKTLCNPVINTFLCRR